MVACGSTALLATPFLVKISMKADTQIAIERSFAPIYITYKSKENIITRNKFRNIHCISSSEEKFFSDHIPATDEYQLEMVVTKIKKIMASKLREDFNNVEDLYMIEAIQRLGLEYYFRDEIHAALEKYCVKYNNTLIMGECGDSLHDVAFRFRLLRQQGYYTSTAAFEKFKNKDGKFKQELAKDIKGLMSLFEASQLSIPGDYILDEAAEFSSKLLKASLSNVEHYEAMLIGNTLRYPYHKSLPRLMAKNLLPNFKTSLLFLHDCKCNDMSDWLSEVQELARIDIDIAQITQQLEITQVSRWWKELQLAETLKVVRDKPVKWHMWSLALLPGPNMAEQRIELTKPISLIYIIDDIFDVCATLEELILFTEAVNRWDYANIVQGLPEYMKLCLKSLHEITNETSHKMYVKHGWNPKDFLKKAWADLCNAFLLEARWFASRNLPTTKEYLKNGIVSSGVGVMYVYIFAFLGEQINHKNIHLFNTYPDIVSSTATIFRLWDDLGTAKDENQDGHDGSYITCYMNEHNESSYENARKYVLEMISDAWKCLNQECLCNSAFSAEFRAACLNIARIIPVMYNYDGTHQLPIIEMHKSN